MKSVRISFYMLLKSVAKDGMLLAACAGPLLAALLMRFGIPALENLLCTYFQVEHIMSPYYLMVDLTLAMMTPYLFCFASAMVLLTEFDEHIAGYLALTPIGKSGYLASRLLVPGGIALLASLLLLLCFSLTSWTLMASLAVCLLFSLLCTAMALLLFSFSRNRVEGMALSKAAGLMLLGLPVPFFLPDGVQYFFAPLPSFWIAKYAVSGRPLFFLTALVMNIFWLYPLARKMDRKLMAG